jgi:hypothetical protein
MIRTLLIALALASVPAAAQQMYKWVDEKGTTHFSEYPPPDGKGAKVEVKPAANEKNYNPDSWRERELESRQRRAQQAIADETERKRDDASRAQNCRRAQEGLDTMKNARRVYNLDEKGERVYLDEKQRAAGLEKHTRDVEKYCR